MSVKSLVTQVKVDVAGKAHNCQASSRHRIEKGDVRLKVRNGRSWDHYCRACAAVIIARDIEKLESLRPLKPSTDSSNPSIALRGAVDIATM